MASGGRSDGPEVRTEIVYETTATAAARATSITLPAPTAGASRPAHSYDYSSSSAQTTVKVKASPTTEFTSTVTYARDAGGGLAVGGTDADGVALPTAAYDAGDRLLSSTDAAGRRSTVAYDADAVRAQPSGRATDTYGPAPAACFGTDNRPNGTCTSASTTPAHSATTYDTNPAGGGAVTGLAATYWANRDLSAGAANHDLAAGAATMVPAPLPGGLVANNWSARYTGEVTLATTGTYSFAIVLTGQARLFIDDRPVVEAWADHPSAATVTGTFANALVGRHRIRLDYATHPSAPAQLALRWAHRSGDRHADDASAASCVHHDGARPGQVPQGHHRGHPRDRGRPGPPVRLRRHRAGHPLLPGRGLDLHRL